MKKREQTQEEVEDSWWQLQETKEILLLSDPLDQLWDEGRAEKFFAHLKEQINDSPWGPSERSAKERGAKPLRWSMRTQTS